MTPPCSRAPSRPNTNVPRSCVLGKVVTLAIWRAGARARERRAQGHAGRVCKFTDHNVRRTPPCSRAPSRPPTQRQQELCLLFGLGWPGRANANGWRFPVARAQLGRLTSSSFRSSAYSSACLPRRSREEELCLSALWPTGWERWPGRANANGGRFPVTHAQLGRLTSSSFPLQLEALSARRSSNLLRSSRSRVPAARQEQDGLPGPSPGIPARGG